ncbi:hypothetical protein LWI29_028676 [Acer saccharum]|uniref:Uncharacterized protein n=1 Tax=Acer saccharum TaxID=4024 RepID=A0AA39SJ44_ACESA|nr:hypothetical protein LWI29_028676 [Acer saccharum]
MTIFPKRSSNHTCTSWLTQESPYVTVPVSHAHSPAAHEIPRTNTLPASGARVVVPAPFPVHSVSSSQPPYSQISPRAAAPNSATSSLPPTSPHVPHSAAPSTIHPLPPCTVQQPLPHTCTAPNPPATHLIAPNSAQPHAPSLTPTDLQPLTPATAHNSAQLVAQNTAQPQFRRWPFRRRPTFSLSSPPSLSPDSRASRQKLEELLQQWSEWQAQHGSSLNRVGDNR